MIAKSVHHVSLSVRDLERSRRFYEGVLGLAPIPRPDLGVPGIWYGAGGVEVHLIVAPEGADVGRPPGGLNPTAPHAAFAIDDYDAACEKLRAEGLEVLAPGPGTGQMWVRDPDGNLIELIVPRSR